MMMISRLLEDNPDCRTVPYDKTVVVTAFPFNFEFFPQSDRCLDEKFVSPPSPFSNTQGGIKVYCTYEEEIFLPASQSRWFEQSAGKTPLFYLSYLPMKFDDFSGEPDSWGRLPLLADWIGGDNLIPVKIRNGEVAYQKNYIPQNVKWVVEYYQKDAFEKRIVRSYVQFFNYCTVTTSTPDLLAAEAAGIDPCKQGDGYVTSAVEANFNYELEFRFEALGWLDLLNSFMFTATIYATIDALIGALTALLGFTVWYVHRVSTSLKNPPVFHFWELFRVVVPAPITGGLLVGIPMMCIFQMIFLWWIYFPSKDPIFQPTGYQFELINADWRNAAAPTLDTISYYRVCRVGTTVFFVGMYMLFLSGDILIPEGSGGKYETEDFVKMSGLGDEEGEKKASDSADDGASIEVPETWLPIRWKRGMLFLVTAAEIFVIVILQNFSYSTIFTNIQYPFIVGYKLFQLVYDQGIRSILREVLLTAPLICAMQVSSVMMIQGAATFVDYVIAYSTSLIVLVASRIYIEPTFKQFVSRFPLYRLTFLRQYLSNRKLTREQRLQEEQDFRRMTEEVALEVEGVEPLLESYVLFSCEEAALVIQPMIQVAILFMDASPFHTYKITQIPANYGIKESSLQYYAVFSVVMTVFQSVLDIFLLNTQELAHSWKVYDYVSYQNYRFNMRDERWIMAARKVDASVSEYLQSIDMLCFSSQYFFAISIHVWGILFIVFGILIMLGQKFDMIGDWVIIIIIFGIWLGMAILGRVLVFLADLVGLWEQPTQEGTTHDETAAKLAVGEGSAAELEQERMELAALNNEAFRARFLERNRPWLISHMAELVTPEVLYLKGQDGRSHKAYIQDIYDKLVGMSAQSTELGAEDDDTTGPGGGQVRRARSAEDYELQLEEQRVAATLKEKWAMATPPTMRSVDLAKWWLAKAQRKIKYKELVVGAMELQKRNACDGCGAKAGEPVLSGHGSFVQLEVGLSTNGEFDALAFDNLVDTFEKINNNDPALFDNTAWKIFFRSNAEIYMRCTACAVKAKKERLAELMDAKYGSEAAAQRAQALALEKIALEVDADGDSPIFDFVQVDRVAPLGRLMTKWLKAARQRMGGVFPRPEARDELVEYTQRINEAKERRLLRMQKKLQDEETARIAREEGEITEIEAQILRNRDLGFPATLDLPPVPRALALKWMLMGRQMIIDKQRAEAIELRRELVAISRQITPNLDYIYTQDLRLRGEALLREAAPLDRLRAQIEEKFQDLITQEDLNLAQAVENIEHSKLEAEVEHSAKRAEMVAKIERDKANASRSLSRQEKKKASLQHQLDTKEAASMDVVETLRAEHTAIVADIKQMRDLIEGNADVEQLREFDSIFEAEIDLTTRRRITEKIESHARSVALLQAKLAKELAEVEEPFRVKAVHWILDAKRAIAKRREAEDVVSGNRLTQAVLNKSRKPTTAPRVAFTPSAPIEEEDEDDDVEDEEEEEEGKS